MCSRRAVKIIDQHFRQPWYQLMSLISIRFGATELKGQLSMPSTIPLELGISALYHFSPQPTNTPSQAT